VQVIFNAYTKENCQDNGHLSRYRPALGLSLMGGECVSCLCASNHKTQNGTIFRLNSALFSLNNSQVSLNITDLTVVTVALNNTFTDSRYSRDSYL